MRTLLIAMVGLVAVLTWTDTADAIPVTLRCSSFQGQIVYAYPYLSTSGGCSTGIFTGTYNNPLEGIITAQVTNDGNMITHNHDIQDTGNNNWLVSTLGGGAGTGFGAISYEAGVGGQALNLDNGPAPDPVSVNEYPRLTRTT